VKKVITPAERVAFYAEVRASVVSWRDCSRYQRRAMRVLGILGHDSESIQCLDDLLNDGGHPGRVLRLLGITVRGGTRRNMKDLKPATRRRIRRSLRRYTRESVGAR
jgi:hypothetical protein